MSREHPEEPTEEWPVHRMATVSKPPVMGMHKPKLRFSIDALMGQSGDGDPSPEPPSARDYSLPKERPARPPVLVPIPTFPPAPAAHVRAAFLGPAAAFYQRTLPHCPAGVEGALAGMLLQGDAYPSYPWYIHRQRLLHHRFQGPELPGYLLPPFRKAKRIRTAFSASQLMQLEGAFDKNHYVTGNERKQLAESLGLTETQVKVWFQNRRTKQKRQVVEDRERTEKSNSISLHKSADAHLLQSSASDPHLSPSGRSESELLDDDLDSEDSYNMDETSGEVEP